jgi:VWFA-related protein
MLFMQPKKFLPIVFAILCFTFSAVAQSKPQAKPTPTATPQEEETEKIFTEEIKLNVNAFDPDGKFVADVKREDLVIMEDGRIHQASSIRRIPANVLIMMDTGGEMRAAKSIKQTRETAKNLINALQMQDSVAVMQYNDKAEIIAEWTDKETALKSLSKANFGKRSMLFNALDVATRFMQKSALDNRHLVLISDGTDSLNDATERAAAMKNLLTTDINVHVISYTQMELADIEPRTKGISKTPPPKALPDEVAATMPPGIRDMNRAPRILTINTDRAFLKKMRERKKSLQDGEKYLASLAADTNGEFILPATNEEMLGKTSVVASFIDSSYVVTYAPKRALKESSSGEVRNIEVTSRRPNLLIEARRKLIVTNEK